jgi:hypothetical protein
LDDPLKQAKAKEAATYDAVADHFDDEPLQFWERIGSRTVARLGLPAGAHVLEPMVLPVRMKWRYVEALQPSNSASVEMPRQNSIFLNFFGEPQSKLRKRQQWMRLNSLADLSV